MIHWRPVSLWDDACAVGTRASRPALSHRIVTVRNDITVKTRMVPLKRSLALNVLFPSRIDLLGMITCSASEALWAVFHNFSTVTNNMELELKASVAFHGFNRCGSSLWDICIDAGSSKIPGLELVPISNTSGHEFKVSEHSMQISNSPQFKCLYKSPASLQTDIFYL